MTDSATDSVTDSVTDGPLAPRDRAFWRANLRLTLGLLLVWFSVSFGAGILFRDALDTVSIGGAPLGFWMAQQGAIYVFVALIFVYHLAMRRLERRYRAETPPFPGPTDRDIPS